MFAMFVVFQYHRRIVFRSHHLKLSRQEQIRAQVSTAITILINRNRETKTLPPLGETEYVYEPMKEKHDNTERR